MERTIRGTNPRPTVDVGLKTCGERPARVKASYVVEKGCLTTKPRTFGLGFSGRLSLSTLRVT